MANQEWGKAHVNNSIGFGQGAANATNGWGSIYYTSWSADTYLVGISEGATDFKERVESDGGTVESIICVSEGIK